MKRFSLLVLTGVLTAACVQAADSRAAFLKLIDRPTVPLAAESNVMFSSNGLVQIHFSFASEKDQRVTGILIKPENSPERRPVVIALHGTGGSKHNMLSLCRKLAARGFVAVAIDGRYHGERANGSKGSVAYEHAIVRAWHEGGEHPFFYDTVWDVMRTVDYLQTREDVDPKRIGLVGISKGGIETYLTAAVDPRIAVAVPCIGVQSFRWALDNNLWQGRLGTIPKAFETITNEAHLTEPDAAFAKNFYDRVAPGIYSEFDGPALLPLIAPRPLLVINGDSDVRTPLPGLQQCTDSAQLAYKNQNAQDHFAIRIQEHTGHQVRLESERAAIEWFVRWLKP